MYTEHEFLDRFDAAARDGFKGVEFLFPYAYDKFAIRDRLGKNNLTQALFNCPPGDWEAGQRGLASLPNREAEFKRGFDNALDYARVIGLKTLHVMAGLRDDSIDAARQRDIYVANLAWAARQASRDGIVLTIEPINTRDVPGFFLNRQDQAHSVCADVGEPNLKVQMDLYHCQIVEGDLAVKIKKYLPNVGHMQIAGVPERHEPDIGEINHPYLFDLIDSLGYSGWIGCEYRPRAGTSAGLGWYKSWVARAIKA
jgi:hydroxypyruvate isomerase